MYHRVLTADQMDLSFSADSIVVTPETFERQMRLLHHWLNPIEPWRLLAMLSGETDWLPRSCVVTFDDGWFDNAENALPILSRTRIPATIFLATGFVGTEDCFWQERLTALLYEEWRKQGRKSTILRDVGATHLLMEGTTSIKTQIRHVVTSIKGWPRADIVALINRIASTSTSATNPSTVDRFMSWDDARRLQTSGWVTLGSHAHSHTPLTMLEESDLKEELAHANAVLNSELGQPARLFAYPNGDHDDPTSYAVRSAGHELAFTTESGLVSPGDNCFRIKRINISESGTNSNARFLCRLFGWF
jgi:peptidoglycan/xylan/chitin deacetylase (PgdA/CDA1 family)